MILKAQQNLKESKGKSQAPKQRGKLETTQMFTYNINPIIFMIQQHE